MNKNCSEGSVPCCSFLFERAVTIRRKKFLLEEVGGLFEGPDRYSKISGTY